jgi:hypothetical protein
MPQNNINDKVNAAKSALQKANSKFTSAPKSTPAPVVKSPVSVKTPALGDPTIGPSLKAKNDNINTYINNTPKMHKGGEVPENGIYNMKKGEHVLTAKQKNAMMAGMSALAKPAKPQGVGPLPGNTSTHVTNKATLGAAKSDAVAHDAKIKK